MNTLFSASGYQIAMKIRKDCETVKKFDNYTKTSRKFDFEIGPSDEFFCQHIILCPECILSCHGNLRHGNCILMSCSDRVRSRDP